MGLFTYGRELMVRRKTVAGGKSPECANNVVEEVEEVLLLLPLLLLLLLQVLPPRVGLSVPTGSSILASSIGTLSIVVLVIIIIVISLIVITNVIIIVVIVIRASPSQHDHLSFQLEFSLNASLLPALSAPVILSSIKHVLLFCFPFCHHVAERERPFKKNWSGLTRFRGYNCNCIRLEILLKRWKKTIQEENVSFKIVIWSCLKNHLCLDCWCFRRLDLYTVLTSHWSQLYNNPSCLDFLC